MSRKFKSTSECWFSISHILHTRTQIEVKCANRHKKTAFALKNLSLYHHHQAMRKKPVSATAGLLGTYFRHQPTPTSSHIHCSGQSARKKKESRRSLGLRSSMMCWFYACSTVYRYAEWPAGGDIKMNCFEMQIPGGEKKKTREEENMTLK